jgi:hypothetical protein
VQLNEQVRFSVIRVLHFVQVHCYTLHVPAFEVHYNLRVKAVFTLKYLVEGSCFIFVICIYLGIPGSNTNSI